MNQCPCSSGLSYQECCEEFHLGKKVAKSPETLMRSRYSAFEKKVVYYLRDTLHPEKRNSDDLNELNYAVQHSKWLGLKILNSSKLGLGDHAFVEFVAFYEEDGVKQLHENSRFKKMENVWYYCDGQILPNYEFERNEICWCGSSKKFKKCHGKL